MPMASDQGLARLLTWLSPAFPVGAFSYSHGIEYAVEAGLVGDADSLRAWIDGILRHGSGRTDAILLSEAWRAEHDGDDDRLAEVLAWGEAFRGTAELALESGAQGRAFLSAVAAAWPHPRLAALAALANALDRTPAYPVTVGVALCIAGVDLETALPAYLQAFAANLVSAGVRLIPLGQSDGLRVVAALEDSVRTVGLASADLSLADLGSATWMVDWTSARHETQYTRLFRS
jgi:urease accessory protein